MRAADRFFERLEGVTDPEEKRKTIGELFIRIFEDARRRHRPTPDFLVQGTLYPDVIESGTVKAAKIKSHHNVGGLPEDMDFELVEPLRGLFKDEVRAGRRRSWACPTRSCGASPSPGPASACASSARSRPTRWPSCSTPTPSSARRSAAPGSSARSGRPSPCCPTSASVGVMGDERTYGYPIIIRAVTSEDAMTADWARLPYDLLERMSSRIINEVRRRQPRGLRHHVEAARHHRVGVKRVLVSRCSGGGVGG